MDLKLNLPIVLPSIVPGPPPTHTSISVPRSDIFNGFGVNFETLKSEQARLDTFRNPNFPWPVEFVEPKDCAKAGFFFLQNGDKVQCAFCRGVAGEWERGDVPMNEHKKHFPRCPFVCNLPVGNIPIGSPTGSQQGATDPLNVSAMGYDVCGPFDSRFGLSGHVPVRGAQPLSNDIDDVTRSLAINTGTGPARTHLVTEETRLKTFADWPSTTGQTPKKLAEAGFYYIGLNDHVKCFYCDGGLRNWEESDDPWSEHARWFQKCPFVLLNKGEEFVKKVLATEEPKEKVSLENNMNGNIDVQVSPRCSANRTMSWGSDSGVSSNASGSDVGSSDEESTTTTTISPSSSQKVTNELEEEVRRLREARQCKICMDNEVSVVFLPCGHLVSCIRCATALSSCALCRQPIKALLRTYMS